MMSRTSLALALALASTLTVTARAGAQAELTGTYIRYFAVGSDGRFMSGTHTFQYTESGSMPYSCDFFYPGSPYEGFYLSAIASGTAFEASNTETGSTIPTVTPTVLTGRTITWSGRWTHGSVSGAQITIDQSVSYADTDRAVRIDVTLRNTGTVALTDVTYGRRGEPDQGSCSIGTDYTTTNDVVRQPPAQSSALVTAIGGTTPVVIGMGAFDARARGDVGGWPGSVSGVWTMPRDPGGLPEDTWIQIALREPSLAAGASTTFTLFYVFGTSTAQVEMRFDELTFPTAPCVGLMEGASCTTMAGATGLCRGGVCCTGCWNGTRCVIGNSGTVCGAGGAMCASCSDGMACTSDVCTAGACSNPPAPMGTTCDDGMFCTLTDRCNASATCVGSGARCDDAEECTTDSCDEAMDRCTNAGRPDLTACTSGGRSGLCRAARCCPGCWTGTTCSAGVTAATCGVGGAMCASCVDPDSCTSDVCTTGVCSNPRAPTGTPCDDGMFCTPTDTCNAAGACIGGGVRCNDGASCTTDTCDESTDACMYVPAEGCTIGGVCVGDGTVNAAYPCLVCDRARNPSDWSMRAAGTPCSMPRCAMGRLTPPSVCTDTGVCSASLSERCPTGACADATSCEPSCVETGCPAGEWCNPMGACAPQLADGATCIADEACTSGECTDGVCCESACDGTCERCDVLGLRGTCSASTAGTDPDMECPLACDGARACMGDTDGGMVATDGGPGVDSGPAGIDGGPIGTIDAGGVRPRTSGGCGCRTGGASSPWLAMAVAVLALAVLRRRR